MAAQTDFELIDLSQDIPAEQIGIDSVLTEMDERTGKLEEKVKGMAREMGDSRTKIKSLQNWRADNAKSSSEKDRASLSRHNTLKTNQQSLIREVNWLRDIIVRAGLVNEVGRTNSNPSNREGDNMNPNIGTRTEPANSDTTYESIWDTNSPKRITRQAVKRAAVASSSGSSAAQEVGAQAGTRTLGPDSILGKYLAQKKVMSKDKKEGNDTAAVNMTGPPTAKPSTSNAGTRAQGSDRGGPSGKTPYRGQMNAETIKSNRNFLDLSDVRAASADRTTTTSMLQPYDNQFPSSKQGGSTASSSVVASDKNSSWVDEISDREMANFYTLQQRGGTQIGSDGGSESAPGDNTGGKTTSQVQPGDKHPKTNAEPKNLPGLPGTSVSLSNETGGDQKPIEGDPADTYASAAGDGEGEWSPARTAKRKWDMRDQKPPLRGIGQREHREIYVQGISMEGFSSKEEVVAMVKDYCRFSGVIPGQTVIIPVRDDDSQTGCKVTIKTSDMTKVMNDRFWPDGIFARPWRQRPKQGDKVNDKHDGNGNEQSE